MYCLKDKLFKHKIKTTHIICALEQLGQLIKADIPILNALDMLMQQFKNNKLSNVILDISKQIKQGEALSKALAIYPKYFPLIISEQIKLAEETGALAEQLEYIAKSLKQTLEIKNNIIKAITYPCIMLGAAIILAMILLIFVIPTFKDIFNEFHAKLPFFTQFLINSSNLICKNTKFYLIIILSFTLALKISYKNNYKFKYLLDFIILKTPVVKKILQNNLSAQFAQTINITTKANMPIDQALSLAANITKNSFVSCEIKKSISKIKTGESLSNALINNFSDFLIQMLQIGEQTGNLSQMLQKAADYHQVRLKESTEKLQQLLEPALTIIVGGIIGAFVIGMYLPIFQLGNIM